MAPESTKKAGRPRVWTDEEVERLAESLLEYFQRPDSLFTEVWCAEIAKIPREYLSRWAAQSGTFREALEMVRTIQSARLLEGSIHSRLNARIACLLLQSVHGYTARSEVTVQEPQDHETKVRAAAEALMTAKPANAERAREWLNEIMQNPNNIAREAAEQVMNMVDMLEVAKNMPTAIVGG